MNKEQMFSKYGETDLSGLFHTAQALLNDGSTAAIRIMTTARQSRLARPMAGPSYPGEDGRMLPPMMHVTDPLSMEMKCVVYVQDKVGSFVQMGLPQYFDSLTTKHFTDELEDLLTDPFSEVYIQVHPVNRLVLMPRTNQSILPGRVAISIADQKIMSFLVGGGFQWLAMGPFGTNITVEITPVPMSTMKPLVMGPDEWLNHNRSAVTNVPDMAAEYTEFLKSCVSKAGVSGAANMHGFMFPKGGTPFDRMKAQWRDRTPQTQEEILAERDALYQKIFGEGAKVPADDFGVPASFSMQATGAKVPPPSDMVIHPESDVTKPTQEPAPDNSIMASVMTEMGRTAEKPEEAPTVEFTPTPTKESLELDRLKSQQEMDEHMEYLRQQMEVQQAREEEAQAEPEMQAAPAETDNIEFIEEANVETLDPNDSLARPQTNLND